MGEWNTREVECWSTGVLEYWETPPNITRRYNPRSVLSYRTSTPLLDSCITPILHHSNLHMLFDGHRLKTAQRSCSGFLALQTSLP